jgi:hypothetical protein
MRMTVVVVSLIAILSLGCVIVWLTDMTRKLRVRTGCYVYVLFNLSGLKDITVRSVSFRHAKTLTMTDRLLLKLVVPSSTYYLSLMTVRLPLLVISFVRGSACVGTHSRQGVKLMTLFVLTHMIKLRWTTHALPLPEKLLPTLV